MNEATGADTRVRGRRGAAVAAGRGCSSGCTALYCCYIEGGGRGRGGGTPRVPISRKRISGPGSIGAAVVRVCCTREAFGRSESEAFRVPEIERTRRSSRRGVRESATHVCARRVFGGAFDHRR